MARLVPGAKEEILESLRWLKLDWDEGPTTGDANGPSQGDHGPYFQSQRGEIYRRRVQELRDKGLAYEHEGALKFRMQREPIVIPDLVVGDVKRELTDREAADPDFVIVRSDGQPVFHLVNVIDDLEMAITHVIRGEDHLSNTAKHIALFRAFGATPPQYAHIPLILNPDGSKMSKRDQGASLTGYMDEGFAPEAVVNYLCLLGWSPKDDRQVMPLGEIVERFDLPQILRANARFDMAKLEWTNYEYLRAMAKPRYRQLAEAALRQGGIDLASFESAYVQAALDTCQDKLRKFTELPAYAGFYFKEDLEFDAEAVTKNFVPENKPRVTKLREAYAQLAGFDAASLETVLKTTAKDFGVKVGVMVHPVRVACTGKSVGPSLYHLMEVLGRERVLKRLDAALARM